MKKILKTSLPHIIALISFMLVSVIYFYPQLEGKVLQQSDLIQFKGMVKEIDDFKKETGETTLWTNSMFSGMPAYQIHAPQDNNLSIQVMKTLRMGFNAPIGYFIVGMIGFYLLLNLMGVNKWLSMIGAVGFALCTNNLVLFEAGHVSKVQAIFTSAPIVAGTILAYRGKYILGAIVFLIFMSLNLYTNHPQMTYYLGMSLGLYILFQLYRDWKDGQLTRFVKASAILILSFVISFGTSASRLLTTYEYSQETMRGKPILESENPNPMSSSETEGLAWDYAMSWSNSTLDLFSSFIPGMTGGSSREPLGSNSAFAKDLSRRGVSVRNGIDGPMYWGGLPFTSGPIYFGAIFVFLFILGCLNIKGPIKWWALSSVVLMLLLSMGKNLEWFNRLFFDYFPLYNKFRTPNSILSVTAIIIPLLGLLGLQKLLSDNIDKEKLKKWLLISGGSLAVLCLFFGLIGPSIFEFSSNGDLQYEQAGYNIEALLADRKSLLRTDSLRSFFLIALAVAAIWFYSQAKIKKNILFLSLGILIFFDFWFVGKRYISTNDFVTKRVSEQVFQARPVDNQILQDSDPYYRVMDLTTNTFESTMASYFHKSIGGYHAAKLQRYQDLIDRHISRNNQRVLNMLNAKYYIVPDNQGAPAVQLNPAALGNAWFVNNIVTVENANAEIDALNTFDPAGDVIIHKEFSDYIAGFDPQKNGNISITDYKPNVLTYSSNSSSDQMAVFSEIWYGPNKGWKAYIDGNETEFIRVNYALRGLKIPSGQHEIQFKFEPTSYRIGEWLSLISSILLFAGLLFLAWKYLLPLFKQTASTEELSVKAVKKKVPATKRKSKGSPKKKK